MIERNSLKNKKMLFKFFEKQTEKDKKVILLRKMIEKLNIDEKQKTIYLSSLDVLQKSEIDDLYNRITLFIKENEMKDISDIKKNNFASFSWKRKKQAEKEQKEINSVNFLLNNL